MYKSRVRFGNNLVDMAFDTSTGELIELINLRNGDNLLKNWNALRTMPFFVGIRTKDGESKLLRPPSYNTLLKHSFLKPKITFNELYNGNKSISISYKNLVVGEDIRNISVIYTVEVKPNDCETLWKIHIKNDEPNCIISSVSFPCLYGVYLGESWKDDILVYPFNAGEKIENPVETYEKEPSAIGWKWQEYKYIYFMDGIDTQQDGDGSFFRQHAYSGPLSMMWLDYYDSEQGLYLACYDDNFAVGSLRAETFGRRRPGMGFSAIKYPEIKCGETWESPYFGLAIHEGDWHWGADTYRRWRSSYKHGIEPPLPNWFRQSPGMVAHYDFKYQGGGIVHRFSDIPKIYEQASDMGLNHILISGWHRDGFDNGFPQYTPDPDLGTEKDLIRAVRHVRGLGGHITFYINSQLCNMKYQDKQELIEEASVKRRNGDIETVGYGDSESIVFATMCSGSKKWQGHLKRAVYYLVDTVGADGIYFDQLGMAKPQFCYDERHGHHIASWNHGYKRLLVDIIKSFKDRGEDEPVIFYEGVTDIHGNYVSGQLISTFFYYHTGAYPELYRYTFPKQILIDMVYPYKGLAMRPVHVGQASREMINKAFVIETYLWIYDLEEDNTFRRDPEQLEYLKKVIRLRKVWLELYGHGVFRDTVGINVNDSDIMAKLYELGDGSVLIAVANGNKKIGGCLRVYCDVHSVERVLCHYLDNPDNPIELMWAEGIEEQSSYLELELADCELALIYIEL